jgi:hypothetical protein
METPSEQEVTKHVSAAFDSVNLINKETLKESTEERRGSVDRNFRHLEHMLTKEWFSESLTAEQRTNIDTAILSGTTYIS